MPKLDQFFRIQEAAEYLGVCRNTLRNWCRQGKIPEYRHPVNNYRLFKVSDLDQLLRGTEQAVNNATGVRLPTHPR
ncbi:MAG: helix-turn-helix domain-containing protein [Planctomycetes bacterium]|nr:helix-turn-helix domain-containing protein [Planctomycetota bacterium]